MKVLVTGGGGYIGSLLVPALLEQGYVVTVLDDFRFEVSSLLAVVHHRNLTIVNGDIRDHRIASDLFTSHDVLIPLAALVGAPLCDKSPHDAKTINLEAPLNMFKLLSPNQLVLMPTTNSAYGTSDTVCDEKTVLKPLSTYAAHKVEVEKALMDRENSTSFRLATVFGASPRMRIDLLVNDFVYKACKDAALVLFESNFKRNYIHVRDVCNTFIWALENGNVVRGEIFNVGLSSANLSKAELCETIKQFIPNFVWFEHALTKDPDQRNYVVSNAKLEAKGWLPQYTIHDGIEELIKAYKTFKKNVSGNV